MGDLQIWKVVHEIEYPAAAAIFDNRGKIATNWQWQHNGELSEWRISSNQVVVHNLAQTISLTAGYKNSVVSMEAPRTYKDFAKLAADFLSDVLPVLKVGKIDVIKLRVIYLAEKGNFKSLVHTIRRDLYSITRAQWRPLGGYPEDVGLSLKLRLGEDKVNLQLGPMETEEAQKYFQSTEVKEKVPETSLYVSYELYREKPKVSSSYRADIAEFLRTSEERIRVSAYGFVDQFGGFEK